MLFVLFLTLLSLPTVWAQQKEFYSAAGGTMGGSFYLIMAKLAGLVRRDFPQYQINVEVTASGDNYRLLASRKSDFSIGVIAGFWEAYTGAGLYKGQKFTELRGLVAGADMPFHIWVRSDSPIKSVADFKGKILSLGVPGSIGAATIGPAILEAYGLSKNDVSTRHLGLAASCDSLRDGNIVGVGMNAGVPLAAFIELSTAKPMRLIPLDRDRIQALSKKFPYLYESIIKAKSYPHQNQDILTVSTRCGIMTNADLPEELAYATVKTIMTREKEFSTAHPTAKDFADPQTVLQGMILPVHPGAIRYFKEIGIWDKRPSGVIGTVGK